jgi:hypothetical protein
LAVKDPSTAITVPKWNKLWLDDDFFHHYLIDQTAAERAWDLIVEDVFIVTDRNRRVIFANIKGLGEFLLGREAMETLVRCLDKWKFFTPLPRPETSRHVVDEYIRRLHPELDPSAVSIDKSYNAVMAVAHYGCWARKGDPHGKHIVRTLDARLAERYPRLPARPVSRVCQSSPGDGEQAHPFSRPAARPAYYDECIRVFSSLPENSRVCTDDEYFISLFALGINGYTQRHRDVKDIDGGLAGLFSTGGYKGEHINTRTNSYMAQMLFVGAAAVLLLHWISNLRTGLCYGIMSKWLGDIGCCCGQ